MDGVRNAVLDGFQLVGGNATSTVGSTATYKNGGGVLVEGGSTAMSGNALRNCVISNCTAEEGAGVMVEGTGAQLEMVNCIVHNNTSTASTKSAICVNGEDAKLDINHCTIRGNIGYAVNNANGTVTMNNSVAHANTSSEQTVSKMSTYDNTLCFKGTISSGSNNLWDYGGVGYSNYSAIGSNKLTYVYGDTNYPNFANPTINTGAQTSLEDVTKYGGDADFTPTNMSPLVNAASDDSMSGTDLTCTTTRDYGGAADIGALEDVKLPAKGDVIYVRDYGNTTDKGGDGSSWDKAINGNCTSYVNDHKFQGYDLEVYGDKQALTGLQWAVDEAYYRSLVKDSNEGIEYKTMSTRWTEQDGVIKYQPTTSDGANVNVSKVDTAKTVQVWVAKGEYVRAEGFFMRNSVDVLGGFPPKGNPGENERAPKDYETIIETMTTKRNEEVKGNNYSIGEGETYSYVGGGLNVAKDWEAKASSYEVVGEDQWDDGNPKYVYDGIIGVNQYSDNSNNVNHFWHARYTNTKTKTQKHFLAINLKEQVKSISKIIVNHRNVDGYAKVAAVYGTNNSTLWNNLPAATSSSNPQTSWTSNGESSFNGLDSIDLSSNSTTSYVQTLTFSSTQDYQYYVLYFDNKEQQYAMVLEVNFVKVSASNLEPYTLTSFSYCSQTNNSNTQNPEGLDYYDLNNYTNAYKQKRVLTQQFPYFQTTSDPDTERSNHALNPYTRETVWNGLTIRNGIISVQHGKDGGAGVALRDNGVLENCVISNNENRYAYSPIRGGGVFCNGGTFRNCRISDNTLCLSSSETIGSGAYGGGAYIREGVMYNTLVDANECYYLRSNTKNYSSIELGGGGAYYENGIFYNNTFVRNMGYGIVGTTGYFTSGSLRLYNNLIYGNKSGGNYDVVFSLFNEKNSLDIYMGKNYIQNDVNTNGSNKPTSSPVWLDDGNGNITKYDGSTYQTTVNNGNDKVGLIKITSNPFVNYNSSSTSGDGEIYELNSETASALINSGYEMLYKSFTTSDSTGTGDKDAGLVEIPDVDANYTDRIKDCALDIGAYEYDGTKDITPNTSTTDGAATFYVSELGSGDRSAKDASNAACWKKLQKVLDAAGRYKANNPTQSVKVLLAGFSGYSYYKSITTASTSTEEENPRDNSIIVPRGVTVEGGYNDADVTIDDATMTPFTYRNVLDQPSILTGQYESDDQQVNVYHTVTFTEDTYDADGKLLKENALQADNFGKAVLDGLFITGGVASGQSSSTSVSTTTTITSSVSDEEVAKAATDRDGGAAVVTSYAHIRNCIIYGNEAANRGGALFLEPGALVSGCAIVGNTAKNGGGIYVQEPETTSDDNMPHVYTSTIVGNNATSTGGGVYFNTHLRVNSTLIWQNSGNQQENVSGTTDPYYTSSGEAQSATAYPLAYCAVENMRVAGLNNISVDTEESKGVRFDETKDEGTSAFKSIKALKSDDDDDEVLPERFFYIKKSSVLARSGMPRTEWDELRTNTFTTLEQYDFANVDRTNSSYDNTYIEIGARAYNGLLVAGLENIMYRLFVAKAEETNDNMATALINSSDAYYSQQGSSFANPMHRLDDALEYIHKARKKKSGNSYTYKDKIFEIYVAGGTYYPYRTLNGDLTASRAKTYAVPEGVHIYGGVSPETYYCGIKEKEGNDITSSSDIQVDDIVSLIADPTEKILDNRKHYDHNKNNIVEPWEFEEQTILSGKVVNSEGSDRSYHVISCMADEAIVGGLPSANATNSDGGNGKKAWETGLRIVLDGLQIEDGMAYKYKEADVASKFTYYKGGAICVEGNWVSADVSPSSTNAQTNNFHPYGDGTTTYRFLTYTDESGNVLRPVGYRNIPLEVRYCNFTNNEAGMGGAIFTDGELNVYGCRFVQNSSVTKSDEKVDINGTKYDIPGRGGAINCSSNVGIANTLFANNEASYEESSNKSQNNEAKGGVLVAGEQSKVTIVNCDFVRNLAEGGYPACYFYQMNKGYDSADTEADIVTKNPHKIVNTIFWGNNGNGKDEYVVNFLSESEENSSTLSSSDIDTKMESAPATLWFCAYQQGHWKTPTTAEITDNRDFRKIPYTCSYSDDGYQLADNNYIPLLFKKYNEMLAKEDRYQGEDVMKVNENIILSDDNDALDGPNFISPSTTAGVDGYKADTDWMIGRINNLVDNGWTYLNQEVSTSNPEGKFTNDSNGSEGNGIYLAYAQAMNKRTPTRSRMPYGSTMYMGYDDGTNDMKRISLDPNPSHKQTYIDLGVYEYQHVRLVPSGDEVDYLWVCERETQGANAADGSEWSKATSDLQRAIETLLASRNDHDKMIFLRSGEYQPVYSINGNLAFTINTSALNEGATAAASATAEESARGVKSLTIQGGFSDEIANTYNLEANPAYLYSSDRVGSSASAQGYVMCITDARQRKTYKSGSGDKYVTVSTASGDAVIPITLDGIIFRNTAESNGKAVGADGAAIYYAKQADGDGGALLSAPKEDGKEKKKLTISNSQVLLSGNTADDTKKSNAAVKIEEGGGEALIYNTLFHSNYGKSLDAVATTVVNSTFALNGDEVTLTDNDKYESALYNSILWRNSVEADKEVYSITTKDNLKHNAIYGYTPTDTEDTNEDLSNENDNVATGPNFEDPENGNAELRDFHINPSLKTMGKADIDTYYNKVGVGSETDVDGMKKELQTTQTLTENTLMNTKVSDLAGLARCYNGAIERGAYECDADLHRIIYVNPSKAVTTSAVDGSSWEKAYIYNQLQSAVDAAAVYAASSNGNSDAYVFVKGKKDGSLGETLTVRDNVKVYGSLPVGFLEQASKAGRDYTDDEVQAFVGKVSTTRTGLAATSTTPSTIEGIVTPSTIFSNEALVDGFVITSSTSQSSPIINIGANNPTVIRNCIVAGNSASGYHVANVENGLLYNVLFRDNSTDKSQVVLGSNAYMVNCTIANASGQATTVNNGTSNVFNNIERDDNVPFAPYFRSTTAGIYEKDLPSNATSNKNLWYQLHEKASDIDKGENTINLPTTLSPYVNFDNDRDLLGNLRKINSMVDNGCFETWNVPTNDSMTVKNAYHAYPHEGSVVYIHDGATLLLSTDNGEKFPSTEPFAPGYLLVKQGGSLYGQGNNVSLSYVAVEKPLSSRYSLVALPYEFSFGHTSITEYTDGAIKETAANAIAYYYDSEQRASNDFKYSYNESSLWEEQTATKAEANEGWLLDTQNDNLKDGNTANYRFTGFGISSANKDATAEIYGEDGSSKTVTLAQYDNKTASTSETSGYSFTNEYNMGWNLRGLPYLVSGYNTGVSSGTDYPMNIPHIVYTLNADNNYDTQQSWAPDATLGVGDGFFTQTATMNDTETLTFKLPVYVEPTSTVSETKTRSITISNEGGTDEVLVNLASENASLSYTLGSDGAKMMALNDTLPQIYIIGANDTRMSLASKAPEEEDIWLGFCAKRDGVYTISLAQSPSESSSQSLSQGEGAVWLTDHATSNVVNLAESDYTMTVESEGEYLDRLTIRFGGAMPFTPSGGESNGYTISVNGSKVTISGLTEGDNVRIITASGALFDSFTARNGEETRKLHKGYYVVNINGYAKTILCR